MFGFGFRIKQTLALLFIHAAFLFTTVHAAPPVLAAQEEEVVREALFAEAPNLEIRTFKKMHNSYSNMVVEINGEWMFRFPRSEKVAETLERETALLDLLAEHIGFSIPRYEFIGKTVAMAGYRKIPGVNLSKEAYLSQGPAGRNHIAKELAAFLYQMHTGLKSWQAEDLGYREYFLKVQMLESTLPGTFEDPDLDALLENALRAFHAEAGAHAEHVILHNDFHGGNMAYDQENNRLTGVFDFTNAVIGEPALDLSYLFTVDSDLVKRTAAYYSLFADGENLYFRAKVLRVLRLSEQIMKARASGDAARASKKMKDLKLMADLWLQDELKSH